MGKKRKGDGFPYHYDSVEPLPGREISEELTFTNFWWVILVILIIIVPPIALVCIYGAKSLC